MVYLMHVCATAAIGAARDGAAVVPILKEIAAGRHLSTLAVSEAGSRSHFLVPVSRAMRNAAGVHISAKKSFVTSASHAHSYVVSALAPDGKGPTDSTLYLIADGTRGLSVAGPWDGLALRGNASALMTLDDCPVTPESQLTDDGAGFQAMLQVVLPCSILARPPSRLCRAAVAGTASHLKTARFPDAPLRSRWLSVRGSTYQNSCAALRSLWHLRRFLNVRCLIAHRGKADIRPERRKRRS